MSEQGSLFQQPEQELPMHDIAEMAERIAASALVNPYAEQDRRQTEIREIRDGEDLAAEQIGHTPEAVSMPPVIEAPIPIVRERGTTRPRLELPGKNGRRNPGSQPLTPVQARKGLSEDKKEDIREVNARGAAAARAALRRGTEGN